MLSLTKTKKTQKNQKENKYIYFKKTNPTQQQTYISLLLGSALGF